MSKLYAKCNIGTSDWLLNVNEIDSAKNYLYITFTNNDPIIAFKNLKFGYELKQDGNIKQYGVYPPPGVRYKRSDQEYLVSTRLKLETEESYSLFLWAENDGQRFEKEFDFETPRPPQPYGSWTWNSSNKVWEAPVPYPDDGRSYEWNENAQGWMNENGETQS